MGAPTAVKVCNGSVTEQGTARAQEPLPPKPSLLVGLPQQERDYSPPQPSVGTPAHLTSPVHRAHLEVSTIFSDLVPRPYPGSTGLDPQ